MADAGVGVYLGGGGSGEGFTLDDDEARRVLEIGVDQIGGRVPVRAMGIEPRTAQQMIDYIGVAAEAGVDAAQIYSLDPGHGHRPTPAEIEAYLRAVLESTVAPLRRLVAPVGRLRRAPGAPGHASPTSTRTWSA